MSNEEKAKAIAELNGICYENHSKYESDMDSTLECYGSAIQMAEWKDEKAVTLYTKELQEFKNLLLLCNPETTGLINMEQSINDFRKALQS